MKWNDKTGTRKGRQEFFLQFPIVKVKSVINIYYTKTTTWHKLGHKIKPTNLSSSISVSPVLNHHSHRSQSQSQVTVVLSLLLFPSAVWKHHFYGMCCRELRFTFHLYGSDIHRCHMDAICVFVICILTQ